jgi:hypothetical protein
MPSPSESEIMKAMAVRLPLILATAIGLAAMSADARPPSREQDGALKGLQQGQILPLRLIEQRVVPKMRGFDYLGPEFDVGSARYRLKFMRHARVVWIDIDARTGQVVGHSGD